MRQFIKSVTLLIMVLVCRPGIGNEPLQKKIMWKVLPIDEKAVLISDDYQIWLLHGLQPNRPTWNEWMWREQVSQPDPSYFFEVKYWEEGKPISIMYSPWKHCEWKETYRNDTSLLQYCDYVIKNTVYKTHVFAKPLQKDELISFYDDFLNKAWDLARRGFYGHAASLLEKVRPFEEFRNKVLTECENKINGQPFDEHYTAFSEKHGFFSLSLKL